MTDEENPLGEYALDMGVMKVVNILPNDANEPTFAFVLLVEPDEDPEEVGPSVLIADIEWAEGLRLATADDPLFDFEQVPEQSVVPMLWHPGEAMEESGFTYKEHFELMTDRVGALAYFGDWEFVRVALQWSRYREPFTVLLYPDRFKYALINLFRNEDIRSHVQDMLDSAEDIDED